MELTRENSRAMIYYDFRSGLTQKQCVDRMISAFGDEAPSKTTIYRWFAEFQRGRVKLSDDPRQGRPKTAVTQENVDAVRKLIEEDRHVTYREIQATLDIGMSQIQIILHEQLGVKKLFSRWIPHSLCEEQKAARVTWCVRTLERFHTGSSNAVYNIVSGDESWIYAYEPETKNQSRVWVFENELKPTKIVRSRSVAKKMVATFVSKTGHVTTIPLEGQRTVNAEWYASICLPQVVSELRKENCNRRIILHHDNASSHTAHRTKEFLEQENIELLDHPPYSPDLSPNDFYTFPKIKNKLRGQRFSSPEEAVDAYKTAILETPTSEWNGCFNDWFHRMEKCVKFRGEYFEKQ
ncbi:transposase [Acinetobacter baumannii]|nr:transposase [Acinetobacter baumannii]